MANYAVRIFDPAGRNEIQVSYTYLSKIGIGINQDEIGEGHNSALIYLDLSSAIKLSKELKRQIALVKDSVEYQKDQKDGQ
jgi:hypothetical protein